MTEFFRDGNGSVWLGDCLEWLMSQPDNSVDLCFGSPPYESQRKYNELGFNLRGQAWVDWMVERVVEMVRVTNGLVALVIDGPTKGFRWSATPALLMANLHDRGIRLRKPPIFHRVGIPGSGGPDWLRNDYEFIVCCSKGRLPWSDNTAMGHPCKYAPGGEMSHRLSSGKRVNGKWMVSTTAGYRDGDTRSKKKLYTPPKTTNPGNVIHVPVGGGRMGSKLAHENEAPFPERLAEFFIRSFCKPGGIVLDPFCGSGTTLAAAIKAGRQGIGIDCRESQCELTRRRIEECTHGATYA